MVYLCTLYIICYLQLRRAAGPGGPSTARNRPSRPPACLRRGSGKYAGKCYAFFHVYPEEATRHNQITLVSVPEAGLLDKYEMSNCLGQQIV